MKRAVFLFLFLGACGGPASAPAHVEPLPAPKHDAALVIVPMGYTDSQSNATTQLRADGTIVFRDAVVGAVSGNEIRTTQGTTIVAISREGNITLGTIDFGRFDPDDAVRAKDGARMFVSDDGLIHYFDASGKPQYESSDKFWGFVPRARRTAEAILLASVAFASATSH